VVVQEENAQLFMDEVHRVELMINLEDHEENQ
jgi:hypothetical protein